jgi:GTPase
LSGGFLEAEVETSVSNGRLFAYLAEHAEVHDTAYHDGRATIRCRIPRRFLHTIADEETTITPVVATEVANG